MGKRFIGSIDVDAFSKAVKDKHSSIVVTDKNRRFANIVIWENDEPDKYKNTHSIQLNSKQDVSEDKVYIGNARPPQQQAAPTTGTDVASDPQDLPF